MVVLDKPTYDKIFKEVPTYKMISQSVLIDRMKINGSLARVAIQHLEREGLIKRVIRHHGQYVYSECPEAASHHNGVRKCLGQELMILCAFPFPFLSSRCLGGVNFSRPPAARTFMKFLSMCIMIHTSTSQCQLLQRSHTCLNRDAEDAAYIDEESRGFLGGYEQRVGRHDWATGKCRLDEICLDVARRHLERMMARSMGDVDRPGTCSLTACSRSIGDDGRARGQIYAGRRRAFQDLSLRMVELRKSSQAPFSIRSCL